MADLTPENGYQYPPAPAKAFLNGTIWNTVMASISGRLNALEAQRTDLEDLIDDLSFNGQARIDEAITPLIEQVESTIEGIQSDVQSLQEVVDDLLEGVIPAENVAESDERVFVTPEEKAEIGQLRTDMGGKANSANVYSKTEIDAALASAAAASDDKAFWLAMTS